MLRNWIDWAERGWIPDAWLRRGIRILLRQRLREQEQWEATADNDDPRGGLETFLTAAARGPIALCPEKANEQHYELPAEFFAWVLGPQKKYSCCYWPPGVEDLTAAEEAMLRLTAQRADLGNGQRILDLGCGWGSLTLWAARQCPRSEIVAVSNSVTQRQFIEARAHEQRLANVTVVTADVNDFVPPGRFDRIVSVEMFEHVRNHRELLRRLARWLRPSGRLFVHMFVHRYYTYPYEADGDANWMARYFFTGGMMPGDDLLRRYQEDVILLEQWRIHGGHYRSTAAAWRARLERHRERIFPILAATYGASEAEVWYYRWRLFFLACEELFGFRNGREWWVSHYVFAPRLARASTQNEDTAWQTAHCA